MTAAAGTTLVPVFAALADETRWSILSALGDGPASASALADRLPVSRQAISKHLAVLETAGLVSRGRDAKYRPARLDAAPLAAASAWIGDYEQFWKDSLGALDSYLTRLQQGDRQ